MPRLVTSAALAATLFLALPAAFAAPPASSAPGTVVIVFKDGHRQSFSLAEIDHMEFPTSGLAATDSGSGPSRARFLGKWEAGDGGGNSFFITLYEDGNAKRSIGDVHGKWAYVNGEALITWDDGKLDAIRKVGSRYRKSAYVEGKTFTDPPDNVTDAHNTTPHPI